MTSLFRDKMSSVARTELLSTLHAQNVSYGILDLPFLSALIAGNRVRSVLDIGTADGEFLRCLALDHPEVQFTGIDNSPAWSASQADVPNLEVRVADAYALPLSSRYDFVFTRFTLQHLKDPEQLVRSLAEVLHPGGLMAFVEPVYDYFDSDPPDPVWQDYRRRLLQTYELMESHPNIPKRLAQWMSESGVGSPRVSVGVYSPATLGCDKFRLVVRATASTLSTHYPDVWDLVFISQLDSWLESLGRTHRVDPYITIAHAYGML